MKQILHQQRMVMWTAILLIAQLAIGLAPVVGAVGVGGTGETSGGGGAAKALSSAADVKVAFDEVMGKPLAERVPLLEALETDIDKVLFEGSLTQKQRCRALEFKYRTQVNMAKFPEAHTTFGDYASALKQWDQKGRAATTLTEFVRRTFMAGDAAECIDIADATLEHWSLDDEVAPAVLYYKARSLTDMPGRTEEAIPVLGKIISDFLDSDWRPKAMRWLGHLQANGWGGGNKAALATLSLIEQQYTGTWWEQYAHMKPAIIFEVRMGDPQSALARFEETLVKFPDHKYATFCRREIERLQKVIEKQLIQDALEGLAKKQKAPAPPGNAPAVVGNAAEDTPSDTAGEDSPDIAGTTPPDTDKAVSQADEPAQDDHPSVALLVSDDMMVATK